MIKNIVFDMGNVLIKFDPDMFIKKVGITNPDDIEILKREIYKSKEWSMMDRGSLTDEEACAIMEKRLPEHLKSVAKKLTCEWDRPIVSIDGAEELIKELKDNNYNIYLLSNASVNQKNYWPNCPGSSLFDGTLVSSSIKHIKPEQEIYKHFVEKFNLNKDECVFIDDSTLNIEAAEYFGMKGIVFHNDYNEVREKLKELQVKVK